MTAQVVRPRGKRILIVDDESDSRDILAQFLENQYDIVVACDGAEGLELAANDPPDLIITDVSMPRLDGLTMVRQLRVRHGFTAPVFFLSALSSPGDVVAAISAGARHYLTKPVELNDLKKRVARALER